MEPPDSRSRRRAVPWLALASIVVGGSLALALGYRQASAFESVGSAARARVAVERFGSAAAWTAAARRDALRTGDARHLAAWQRHAETLGAARGDLRRTLAAAAVDETNAERLVRSVDALLVDPRRAANGSSESASSEDADAEVRSFERRLEEVRAALAATARARASHYVALQRALVITLGVVLAFAVSFAFASHGFDVRAVRRWDRRESFLKARERRREDEYEVAHAALASRERTISREATELRRAADVDSMTGLLNRRGFEGAVAPLLERAVAYGEAAAVVFCDMDGLKEINDRLGHDIGDAALRDTAMLLRKAARASDLVARLGGDEFVVVVERGDEASVLAFEERLTQVVAESNVRASRAYRVSISVGHAIFDPRSPSTVESLLSRADSRMYEAKERRKRQGHVDGSPTTT